MKTIRWLRQGEPLHIETPNGIINIRVGLTDFKGRDVDSIETIPDRYCGEYKVKVIPGKGNTRMIRLKTVKC